MDLNLQWGVGIYVRLLGTPAVQHHDGWLELPFSKASALLYYLARRGSWVDRDELIYLLWPDSLEERARENLRKLLNRSIRPLPFVQDFQSEVTRIRWKVSTDVQSFIDALGEKREAKAFGLYGGELLEGFKLPECPEFEGWLETERQTLHRMWREAAFSLATEFQHEGRYAQAVDVLERLHESNPFDEELLQGYLSTLHLSGQKTKALDTFEAFKRRLEHELSGEPERVTVQLVEKIRQGEATTAEIPIVPAKAPAVPAVNEGLGYNLPIQATLFVGRKAEQAELKKRLSEPSCRLLTVVGPGGIGKTRLTIEVASQEVEAFKHGVRFASLVSVNSPELMIYTVADALGFSFFGQAEPKVQLLEYLKDKQLLLVLDNLEELLTGITLLADILEAAPEIKILATSREPLNLYAEQVFDLFGLSVPSSGTGDVQAFDAVKLFMQCALRNRRDFILDDRSAEPVAKICSLVEGMPLAIELAASWLRVVSAGDIAAEIEKGIDILATSTHDRPSRHRSIRAVFDYSWRVLRHEEQEVLRKLAVFQGGFTREAAAEVAGASLWVLASLVNKSFIAATPTGRYRMHPLMHQYLEEKLQASGENTGPDDSYSEEQATREAHSRYYLHAVSRYQADFKCDKQLKALNDIEVDLDNVRAAWRWAVSETEVWALQQASTPLRIYFEISSRFREGLVLFEQAKARLSESNPEHRTTLRDLLFGVAWCELRIGHFEQAKQAAEQSLSLARFLGESRGIMAGLHTLGHVLWQVGDYTSSSQYFEEGLTLAQDMSDTAELLEGLGWVETLQGHELRAKQHLQEGLALYRQLGNYHALVTTLNALGYLFIETGKPQQARPLFEESLQLAKDIGFRTMIPHLLTSLGLTSYELGDYAEARKLCQEALNTAQEDVNFMALPWALIVMGRADAALLDFSLAREHFFQCLSIAWHARQMPEVLHSLVALAELGVKQGQAYQPAYLVHAVLHHAALAQYSGLLAQRVLAELHDTLPLDAIVQGGERASTMSLEEVVEGILHQGSP